MDTLALEQHFHLEGDIQQTDESPHEPLDEPPHDLPTEDTSKDEQPTSSLPIRVSA